MTNMIAPSPENGATSIEEMPIQIPGDFHHSESGG